jgi:Flp pilus assembly protein TadG
VEFALVAPVLLLLTAGVLNYAMALRTATAVANAARVGAQYGSRSPGTASDAAGIQSAALNSAPTITGLTVTSACSCQCPGGAAVDCSGSCGSGKMLKYVQVTVRATASTFLSYSGLPFAGKVASQASMRAQ